MCKIYLSKLLDWSQLTIKFWAVSKPSWSFAGKIILNLKRIFIRHHQLEHVHERLTWNYLARKIIMKRIEIYNMDDRYSFRHKTGNLIPCHMDRSDWSTKDFRLSCHLYLVSLWIFFLLLMTANTVYWVILIIKRKNVIEKLRKTNVF
jgi:hypothetical protein